MFKVLNKDGYSLTAENAGQKIKTSETGDNCCREVYIANNVVIKFEGFDSDYEQNKHELKFYNEILEEEDKKYFAPILATGEFEGEPFIVQAKVVDNGEMATDEQLKEFENLVEKYNLQDIKFERYDRRNCALTNDGIKIFDCGVVQNPNYDSWTW